MKTEEIISGIAEDFGFHEGAMVREGIKAFVEKKLRETRIEILRIRGKYGISSVQEMEDKYKDGSLEEKGTWQDFQKLDHLEYRQQELLKRFEELE